MPPPWLTPAVAVCTFLALLLIERFVPLRSARVGIWSRVLLNIVVSALAFGVAAVTVRPAVAALFGLESQERVGLLPAIELPAVVEFAIALLLMDWSFYWWHRANHRIPLLWRFHNVHHLDPHLDVSPRIRV